MGEVFDSGGRAAMSRNIFKYILKETDCQRVSMPRGAKLLSVDVQRGSLCLWAIVAPDEPHKERIIFIYGTGHPFPDEDDCPQMFLGTVQQGQLVWHIFEGAS